VWAIYPFHRVSGISSLIAPPKGFFVCEFFHVIPFDTKKRRLFVKTAAGNARLQKALAGFKQKLAAESRAKNKTLA
jgi:hypothetical protein